MRLISRSAIVRVLRVLFAAFDIAAVCVAIIESGSLVNFFSFFTIESNLLAIADVGLIAVWVNSALHQVCPLVLIVDWVFFPPWPRGGDRGRPDWRSLAALAFPLAYFAYSLSRGAAVGWYPYPFLDPRYPGGYGRVAIYAVVLTVVFTLLALAVSAIGRWRAARSA